MHLFGEQILPRGSKRTGPFFTWLLFCSTFMVRAEHRHIQKHSTLSLQHMIKSVLMLPACHLMPQWGTHWDTQTPFSRGTVWIYIYKKKTLWETMPAAENTAGVPLMGRCLKRWQLSRDSDCLVGFLLHFGTEVAAFVVRATLQYIIHLLKHCVLHCSSALKYFLTKLNCR